MLGDFKLSRMKANELNIFARGGVSGVQAHLSLLKLSAQKSKEVQEFAKDMSMIDCLTGASSSI